MLDGSAIRMLAAASLVVCAKSATANVNCTAAFPTSIDGRECFGLQQKTRTPMGDPIKTEADCSSTCCSSASCDTYNWCDGTAATCKASAGGGCWIGLLGATPKCSPGPGWLGGTGRGLPPPPPSPSPGAPRTIALAVQPPAHPIPFELGPNVDPAGNNLSVDSVGFSLNGKRWFPIAGEVHLARLPASQWKEELLRMKAGGLNAVAVYVFWIHHEEVESNFNFTGRRDIRRFFEIVKAVGLKALLRAGPWDHGECRNGGHPDWLLEKAKSDHFALRDNNPGYLKYVRTWYEQLAFQTKGLYFKDGGPIWGVQIDNETSDWKFLLALKAIGEAVGFAPISYTKTGWPDPAAGYPDNYPMLPFFGGYADDFWSNSMTSNPSYSQYTFNHGPSIQLGGASNQLGWAVPQGYPWLDVEIGGGMAAAYNHRVHMDSGDMPSMHLVDVANGVNALGYYMYHGGNNPHSLAGEKDPEAPENTLQESSFQPAGGANPMPSFSYDFYAPLGEFGQPRQHYHQMRRLHLMLGDSNMAALEPVFPDDGGGATGLRWAARSNGKSGFIFVNNYQRLTNMPTQNETRFEVRLVDNSTLAVPSTKSPAFDVKPGKWFAWPFNQEYTVSPSVATDDAEGLVLAWATAQLVCTVALDSKSKLVLLAETDDVAVELGFEVTAGKLSGGNGTTVSAEAKYQVARVALASGCPTCAAATFIGPSGGTITFVVLPAELHDRVWKAEVAGAERVFIGELNGTQLVLTEGNQLHLRSDLSTQLSVLVAPRFASVAISADTPKGKVAGVDQVGLFSRIAVDVGETEVPVAKWTLTAPAAPPRTVPVSPQSHKAEEPTGADWLGAARYAVMLSSGPTVGLQSNVDLRLQVDYGADCARVYLGARCLTDNWYSGYRGDGSMQLGLNYLAGENPAIFTSNLTLLVLPLKQASLEDNVFVQKARWPVFGPDGVANTLNRIEVLPTFKVSLDVA